MIWSILRCLTVMLGIARSTVQDNLDRAKAASLNWPLAGDLTDGVLEGKLAPAPSKERVDESSRICTRP